MTQSLPPAVTYNFLPFPHCFPAVFLPFFRRFPAVFLPAFHVPIMVQLKMFFESVFTLILMLKSWGVVVGAFGL